MIKVSSERSAIRRLVLTKALVGDIDRAWAPYAREWAPGSTTANHRVVDMPGRSRKGVGFDVVGKDGKPDDLGGHSAYWDPKLRGITIEG